MTAAETSEVGLAVQGRPARRAQTPATNSLAGPGRQGMRKGARDQIAALLPIRERVLGPELLALRVGHGEGC